MPAQGTVAWWVIHDQPKIFHAVTEPTRLFGAEGLSQFASVPSSPITPDEKTSRQYLSLSLYFSKAQDENQCQLQNGHVLQNRNESV